MKIWHSKYYVENGIILIEWDLRVFSLEVFYIYGLISRNPVIEDDNNI